MDRKAAEILQADARKRGEELPAESVLVHRKPGGVAGMFRQEAPEWMSEAGLTDVVWTEEQLEARDAEENARFDKLEEWRQLREERLAREEVEASSARAGATAKHE